jgi:hypothetical protein
VGLAGSGLDVAMDIVLLETLDCSRHGDDMLHVVQLHHQAA